MEEIIQLVPDAFRGPGGAAAVLKDGEVVARHVWGYADFEQRIPMSSQTQMPICSITKQMICRLLIDLEHSPPPAMAGSGGFKERLFEKLQDLLPEKLLHDNELTIDRLCDMQSGLRDYWALCMACGALPESRFSLSNDARQMIHWHKTFHFRPGSEFSYSNTNFYLLGHLIESVCNEPLGDLLTQRVFKPAGMTTALLCPDTSKLPSPCVGYEGDEQHGFVRAQNFIEWAGDAGIVASLDDMIAYERLFDLSWSKSDGPYRSIVEPRTFTDGTPARYRYGLVHGDVGNVSTVGHGGALRGFRSYRLYAKAERISVIVLFNHEANAAGAAEFILRKVLNIPKTPSLNLEASKEWMGSFLDSDTQLAVTIALDPTESGRLLITYAGHHPENVNLVTASRAESQDMVVTLQNNTLTVQRLKDNRVLDANRILDGQMQPTHSLQGVYYCEEIDSTFRCEGTGITLYGAFDGMFGRGPANLMKRLGEKVWTVACARGVDAPAPGDWTVVSQIDDNSHVVGLTIGCWLARRLIYKKLNSE
ncbi:beta-lactamase/transpeptidase-like protein [Rhizodiscina lignyota]|uniref:Beta-lactamase/transpeptidase-like protein n=1 Tax=Rhizodiscina lignyota TaxID=1504668 RepID=A0A9P4IGE0_9PEZI|nr:beta-lactamase/transpeptidase-like protein [Rhizodiscina lignyota]